MDGFISVTPLLTLEEAQMSMQNATDFVQSQNGTVVVETLPSFYAFFNKYAVPHEEVSFPPQVLLAAVDDIYTLHSL